MDGMERNANYFLVGLVVLGALAGIIVFLTWILSGLGRGEMTRYSILFNDSVSGLNINSAVEYQGVRVGKVIAIALDADRPREVRVDIEVKEETPITQSTKVELGLQGITGLSRIELQTTNSKGAPPEKREGFPYPVLKGDGRQITKLFEEMPRIAANISRITERINLMLTDETAAAIQLTVKNMSKVSSELQLLLNEQNRTNISQILENVASASGDFATISERINKTAAEFETLARQLRESLAHNQQHIDRFSQDGLNELINLSKESRKMAKEIRKLADTIEEDPSQLIYKPQTDGVTITP
jgi:phospholipid/cholesterol/gamma-HCH transport system substrate-binding protein